MIIGQSLNTSYEYVLITYTCMFVISILLIYINGFVLFLFYLGLHKFLLETKIFSTYQGRTNA